ncbi:hypothetical protein [Prevotella histicola]
MCCSLAPVELMPSTSGVDGKHQSCGVFNTHQQESLTPMSKRV